MNNLLTVEGLCTYFFTYRGIVKALNGVHLSLGQREIIGLIGETGSGKSVTARSIIGLVKPPGRIVDGKITFDGINLRELSEEKLKRLRGQKIALIVQNPRQSLNPMAKVGDQIANVCMAHQRVSKKESLSQAVDIMERVGIRDSKRWANSFPHQLSGGMAQRICIAMALVCRPKLLIADEPTSNLDLTIQKQILELIKSLWENRRSSILLITHDMGIVVNYCQRVAVMYAGQIVEFCRVNDFLTKARHPYSQALIGAIPEVDSNHLGLFITGTVPNMIDLPSGCYFHPRCNRPMEICRQKEPGMIKLSREHMVKCHLVE